MSGRVLLIGFSKEEVNALRESLPVPAFEVPEYCRDWVVSEIVEKAENLSGSSDWHLRKFVIMHGLDNETLKDIIRTVKSLNPGRAIFATTTETSLTWRLEDLLNELIKEDEYFRALRWAREEAERRRGPFLDIGKG
ncbi:DUF3783 domain-containing protein [Thermococcus thioreducens]|uniref:DUF3783 domain-containing protein n=1 Tax=Thermococcus thioreducens TaxID=277988 RepID=A0A0Q2S4K2_9EURY|nr:DUF3783 domain-containing protein [Thermococcus thioreducens]ASJ12619.1 hypothetical protein A3L14_06835 [Thermococcus thioreducens]KQH82387.1 hypothetical protein AMR53_05405 [Thermococcus thioreducens]SEV87784.1 protein of unknown function [Thermococcus thioreducens]